MNKFRFFIASILLLIPAVMFSQMKVSGTVTEAATGDPLPGVNIQIVGTTQGNYLTLTVITNWKTLKVEVF